MTTTIDLVSEVSREEAKFVQRMNAIKLQAKFAIVLHHHRGDQPVESGQEDERKLN